MTQKPDAISRLLKAATDHFQTVPDEPCPPEADLREYYLTSIKGKGSSRNRVTTPPLLRGIEEHVMVHCGICYKKLFDWLHEDTIEPARAQAQQLLQEFKEGQES